MRNGDYRIELSGSSIVYRAGAGGNGEKGDMRETIDGASGRQISVEAQGVSRGEECWAVTLIIPETRIHLGFRPEIEPLITFMRKSRPSPSGRGQGQEGVWVSVTVTHFYAPGQGQGLSALHLSPHTPPSRAGAGRHEQGRE